MENVCQDFLRGECIRGENCPLKHPGTKGQFGSGRSLRFVTSGVVKVEEGKLVEEELASKVNKQFSTHMDGGKERKTLYEQLEENKLRQEELLQQQHTQQQIQVITNEEFMDLERMRKQKEAKQREIEETTQKELRAFQEAQKKRELKLKEDMMLSIDFLQTNKPQSRSSEVKIVKRIPKHKKSSESVLKMKSKSPKQSPKSPKSPQSSIGLLNLQYSSDSD